MSAVNVTSYNICDSESNPLQKVLLFTINILFVILSNVLILLSIKFIGSKPPGRKLVKFKDTIADFLDFVTTGNF